MMRRFGFFLILFLVSIFSSAHELKFLYLQMEEVEANEFKVTFKKPISSANEEGIEIIYPGNPKISEVIPNQLIGDFEVVKSIVTFNEPISGKSIYIKGLNSFSTAALVNVRYLTGESVTLLLNEEQPRSIIKGSSGSLQVIETYTILGIEHILFGFDHLLFVLALIIISKGGWKVVKTVTAFTIAHSITLTLASLDMVYMPSAPVEAVIALSIVFLAVEIIHLSQNREGLTSRKPWLVAFSFGLLHGFGFAGALSDIGLPLNSIPMALGFFNVGVELGQLAFVFLILIIFKVVGRFNFSFSLSQKVLAYGIGSISSFWMIERVVGFWV